MEVFDKYSEQKIGEVTIDERSNIDIKIELAKRFFESYRLSTFETRKVYLQVIIDILIKHKDKLTNLIVEEAGKPLFYAKSELDRCIRTAELGLNYFDQLQMQKVNVDLEKTDFSQAHTKRFPLGIIFGISPFNFPLNLALHKIIPAIASGNVILLKPSPYTPLSLDFLIKKVNKHLPKGLLTIVHCSNDNAEYIVKHQSVRMVSFTGSDQVGWHIKSLIPKKKVALELGGNAAIYVDKSAKADGLAKVIAESIALYAGQICISTQRIFVHEAIYISFKTALIKAFQNISSGTPKDNVYNSPLIDKIHLNRLARWIENAQRNGSQLLVGGKAVSMSPPILAPTLLEGGSLDTELFQEEAFGPVGVLHAVENEKKAAQMINNSKYGLQAGFFATDKKVEDYLFNHLEVGGIIVNGVPGFRRDEMPYGGIKDSGFGREGIAYAIDEMTELKLCIR